MKNRRIGPDTVLNIITGISIVTWVVLGVVFIILAISKPTSSGMAASRPGLSSGVQLGTTAIYGLLVFLLILSVAEIIFNMTRMKRKSDKMRLTPIFSGILSIAGLIFMNIK